MEGEGNLPPKSPPRAAATYGTVQGDKATDHSGTSNDSYQFIQPAEPDETVQTFTVSDMEAIFVYNTHVPCAIGYKYAGDLDRDVRCFPGVIVSDPRKIFLETALGKEV